MSFQTQDLIVVHNLAENSPMAEEWSRVNAGISTERPWTAMVDML
jgi:hypothetical protein